MVMCGEPMITLGIQLSIIRFGDDQESRPVGGAEPSSLPLSAPSQNLLDELRVESHSGSEGS